MDKLTDMKKKSLIIIFLLLVKLVSAQDRLHLTDSLRRVGNYNLAINYHLLLYKAEPNYSSNIYNMACCYSLLKNNDSAFYYLNIAMDVGQNDAWALADYDLNNLHSDKRWIEIEKRLEKIYKEKDTTINVQLGWELSKMYNEDQAPRFTYDDIIIKYGRKSPQMDSLFAFLNKTDSIHRLKLEEIINKYGFPNKFLVGAEAANQAFIIILHAPLEYQKKYFKLIEEAVNKGDIDKQSMAYLTDKILTKEGKKQLYGTQLKYSEKTASYEFQPIEDEKNVNSRRSQMGMNSIEEYAKSFRMNYKQ